MSFAQCIMYSSAMKEQILEMLEALRSDDERAQLHAVLNLSLLVEKALIPAVAKQNSEMLKDLNLLDLDVSGQEADAILERICQVVFDADVSMGIRVSTVGLLDELDEPAHAQYLKAVLRDLARRYKLMYNDDVCGMLKLVPPAFFEKVSGEEVQSLLREYNILEIFNELEGRTYDDVKQEFERECPPELQCILERDAAKEAKDRLREQKYHIELKKAIERLRAQIGAR